MCAVRPGVAGCCFSGLGRDGDEQGIRLHPLWQRDRTADRPHVHAGNQWARRKANQGEKFNLFNLNFNRFIVRGYYVASKA